MSTSGMASAMVPAADISFQMTSNCVTSPCTPTGNVCAFGVLVRMRANKNSLHENVKTMTAAANSPGQASGRSTRRKAVQRLAPSVKAASSSSRGISERNPFSIHIVNGRLKSE